MQRWRVIFVEVRSDGAPAIDSAENKHTHFSSRVNNSGAAIDSVQFYTIDC